MSLFFRPLGGLGNILFIHNAAYAYSRKRGLTLEALGDYDVDNCPPFSHWKNLFNHVKIINTSPPVNWDDPRLCEYTPIPDGVSSIHGFYQCYKYFSEYRTEIRDLLRTNESELWASLCKKFKELSCGKPTVCVHVRMGDYRDSPIHRIVPESYYAELIPKFPLHKFLIFSNEISVVKKWRFWEGLDVNFVDDTDETPKDAFVETRKNALEILFLMSMCNNFILGNSTLSVMAYHMREDEIATVFIPSPWFAPGGPQIDSDNLII
jgi:hypothetical protein